MNELLEGSKEREGDGRETSQADRGLTPLQERVRSVMAPPKRASLSRSGTGGYLWTANTGKETAGRAAYTPPDQREDEAASATARVPAASSLGALSPAAWMSWAASTPRGRSARTMQ